MTQRSLLLLYTVLILTPTGNAITYTMTDLTTQPGWVEGSTPVKLNNRNQIAGRRMIGNLSTAFFWDQTTGYRALDGLAGPGTYAGVGSLNDQGTVIGTSDAFFGRAVTWTNSAIPTTLDPVPASNRDNLGTAINNRGQVVITATGPQTQAYLVNPGGSYQEIPDLPGGQVIIRPTSMNIKGEVVGRANQNSTNAFFWSPLTGTTDIGDFAGGGVSSAALDINDSSQVVGFGTIFGGTRAFLWSSTTGLRDLGLLTNQTSGGQSRANAINNSGTIIGVSDSSQTFGSAFVWNEGTGMQELDTLTTNLPTGWTLFGAEDINESGTILAYALDNNSVNVRPVLLRPVPEPLSVVGLLAGIGLLRRRKRISE